MQIVQQPMGYIHKRLLESLSNNYGAFALFAFIDNCNHRTTSRITGKEEFNFNTFAKRGEIIVAVYEETKKGQEYAYTYSPNLSNEKFIDMYGFFLKNNPNANINLNINILKTHFSRKKNDLCKELRCFDQNFDNFYLQNEMETASLLITINKNEVQKRLMDAFRLYTFPESRLVRSEVIKRLSNGLWLNYDSEIRAFAFFRDAVLISLTSHQLSYVFFIFIK